MAADDIAIVNGALRKLGVDKITALADSVEAARVATDTYSDLLDAVLADAPWDFATTRASVTVNVTAPTFGFDNAFDFPSSPYCLLVREIENLSEYLWTVEGRQVLTNHGSPLKMIYTARMTTETDYSPKFIEAFEARLAAEWAEPLVKSTSVQEVMFKLYQEKITAARTVEAGQSGLHEDTTDGAWVDSRLG